MTQSILPELSPPLEADPVTDRLLVGMILRPHGVRGLVKLANYTTEHQEVLWHGPVTTESGHVFDSIELQSPLADGALWIARLSGVEERDGAGRWRGQKLYVPRDRLPELPEDAMSHYYHDLVGCLVYRDDRTVVGKVEAVRFFGASDLLEVRIPGRKETEFFAFIQEYFPEVDVRARAIYGSSAWSLSLKAMPSLRDMP
jgi:16S rRNA processing protein RimM